MDALLKASRPAIPSIPAGDIKVYRVAAAGKITRVCQRHSYVCHNVFYRCVWRACPVKSPRYRNCPHRQGPCLSPSAFHRGLSGRFFPANSLISRASQTFLKSINNGGLPPDRCVINSIVQKSLHVGLGCIRKGGFYVRGGSKVLLNTMIPSRRPLAAVSRVCRFPIRAGS